MTEIPNSRTTTLTLAEVIHTEADVHPTQTSPLEANTKLDIEHAVVEDDPRIWSNARKNVILFVISGASMIAGLCANIQNRGSSSNCTLPPGRSA
ncbi:hypothetical protein PAXRUDRAFT_671612 [Paxillus rubicundulus Ve08.2h10]|uniref:Uncharacterized protein n=1 Tax=Paxillus rubicundulus Ve08.2h10 TaxID=930991 RepID=A0A0D0DJH0_9AGAM|nr:hypothetical protein PAXRUDRAFT_671612 [Paxillus rubicundulus Ve08.2h10]